MSCVDNGAEFSPKEYEKDGTSLVVQRVKSPPWKAGDEGSIPGWGTKTPHATGAEPACPGARVPQ